MAELCGIGIPRDLMVDILSRLPTKTLCNFRCVSKPWLRTISPNDPYFIQLHRNRSKRNPLLVFLDISMDEDERFTVRFSSVDTDGALHNHFTESIEGPVFATMSCMELICLVTYLPYYVYVCNPSTKELTKLPYSSKLRATFDVGFGFLPSSNEYKIIHLFEKRTDRRGFCEVGCQVFTITDGWPNSEGSWRVVGDCPHVGFCLKSPVCFNGAVYWIINEMRYDRNTNTRILSFDLETEEFGVVVFPIIYSIPDPESVHLMAMKESLCLVDCLMGFSKIDIWILNDPLNHIWVKEYSFNFCAFDYSAKIVDYIPSVGHGRELLIKSKQEGFVYYNIETESFRRTENLDIQKVNPPDVYFDGFFSLGSRR